MGDLPGIRFQEITPGARSSYNYFALVIEPSEFGLNNRELEEALKVEGIRTKIYFHPPLDQQAVFQRQLTLHLPNTKYLANRVICLPLYNDMEQSLLEQIATAVRRIQRDHLAVRQALPRAAVPA